MKTPRPIIFLSAAATLLALSLIGFYIRKVMVGRTAGRELARQLEQVRATREAAWDASRRGADLNVRLAHNAEVSRLLDRERQLFQATKALHPRVLLHYLPPLVLLLIQLALAPT